MPKGLEEGYSDVLRLTPAEYRVFLELGDGLSSKEVAFNLGKSVKTIDTHLAGIKEKLKANNSDMVRWRAARFVALVGKPKLVQRVERSSEFQFSK